jgi:hypothetical protein
MLPGPFKLGLGKDVIYWANNEGREDKKYVGMRRLAENREEWRAATNQSLD